MEDRFNLLPEEIKLNKITISDEYEYGEMVFSPAFLSIARENTKLMPTMEENDPRRLKMLQLIEYMDIYLKETGWKFFEICHRVDEDSKMHPFEIRRFRRFKK